MNKEIPEEKTLGPESPDYVRQQSDEALLEDAREKVGIMKASLAGLKEMIQEPNPKDDADLDEGMFEEKVINMMEEHVRIDVELLQLEGYIKEMERRLADKEAPVAA